MLRFGVRRWLWDAALAFCALVMLWLEVPAVAHASTATSAPTLLFPWQQVWPLVIGAIVPLVTYVINHVGPWVSEPIKAAVLVVAAAAATALYTALATNVIGFNAPTLQLVLTGVAAALASHHMLWKPSGVAGALGGGSNRQPVVAASSARATPAVAPDAAPRRVGPDAPQA